MEIKANSKHHQHAFRRCHPPLGGTGNGMNIRTVRHGTRAPLKQKKTRRCRTLAWPNAIDEDLSGEERGLETYSKGLSVGETV